MCPFSPHPCAIRNDKFSSWRSLFFYRCTDMISYTHLKSQGISSRASKVSPSPTPSKPQQDVGPGTNETNTWLTSPILQRIGSPANTISTSPAPTNLNRVPAPARITSIPRPTLEPQGVDPSASPSRPFPVRQPVQQQQQDVKSSKSNVDSWFKFTLFESLDVEPRKTHVREQPVTTILLPCSPKSIYILASLVRRPSIKCFWRDTDVPNPARNPAPP